MAERTFDDGLIVGMTIAAGIVVSAYDNPTIAEEIIGAGALDVALCKKAGVDDYDLELLRDILPDGKPTPSPEHKEGKR